MDPDIDNAIENDRENAEARQRRDSALALKQRLETAVADADDWMKDAAATGEVDHDDLLAALMLAHCMIKQPPNDVAGRLAWLAGQLKDAQGVVHREFREILGRKNPRLKRRLKTGLADALGAINLCRLALDHETEDRKGE